MLVAITASDVREALPNETCEVNVVTKGEVVIDVVRGPMSVVAVCPVVTTSATDD